MKVAALGQIKASGDTLDALPDFDIDGALDDLPDSDDGNDAPAAAPTVPKDLPEAHCHTTESGSVCRQPRRNLFMDVLAAGQCFLQGCQTYDLVAASGSLGAIICGEPRRSFTIN